MPRAPDSFEEIVGELGTASDFTPDPFSFMREIAYIITLGELQAALAEL